MSFYIVAKYPNIFSWTYNSKCDNLNLCTFKIENDYLMRCNDNKYLSYLNKKLYFSEITKTKIILEKTNINTNFRIKINDKYIKHSNSNLICEYDDESENFLNESTWVFIENKIDTSHDIIVARYKEDVSWTRYLQANVIIYNKGLNNINLNKTKNNIKIINLENVGREGHTYLYHIINNYNNLAERTTFLQGNPFTHSPDLLELLCQKKYFEDMQSLSAWYCKRDDIEVPNLFTINLNLKYLNGCKYSFYPINNNGEFFTWDDISWKNKLGFNSNKNLTKFLKKIDLEKKINNEYKFIIGALFSVIKKNILLNTLENYIKIKNELLSENPQGGYEGYLLERLWNTIFSQ